MENKKQSMLDVFFLLHHMTATGLQFGLQVRKITKTTKELPDEIFFFIPFSIACFALTAQRPLACSFHVVKVAPKSNSGAILGATTRNDSKRKKHEASMPRLHRKRRLTTTVHHERASKNVDVVPFGLVPAAPFRERGDATMRPRVRWSSPRPSRQEL